MTSYRYIEDFYIDAYDKIFLEIDPADQSFTQNFYSLIISSRSLTEKQGIFLLRILKKYKKIIQLYGLEVDIIDNPIWKNQFRVLDPTKHISLKEEENTVYLCLKHPFAFKEKFEKEVLNSNSSYDSVWNDELKERYYPLYKCNLILTKDFADKYQFTVSNDFLDAVAIFEEVLNNQESYEPICEIEGDRVILKNSIESAEEFFQKNKTGDLEKDIFLAKKLGYRLSDNFYQKNAIHKIAATATNFFHSEKIEKVLDVHKKIGGKIVILVNEQKSKLKDLIDSIFAYGYSSDDVKVGFRESNDSDTSTEFNTWIKHHGLGGDLKSASILIFKTKPPKWLMKDEIDVNIILINGSLAPSSEIAQRWIDNHHCVVFLDEIAPSIKKENICVRL